MTRCPWCFEPLFAARQMFRCVGTCDVKPDPQGSKYQGESVGSRPVFWSTFPEPVPPRAAASCPTCHARSDERVCSRCHRTVEPEWAKITSTCIALAGARATGKSIYIGVAVRQLKAFMELIGGTFDFADGESETQYTRLYEDALFGKGRRIAATNPSRGTVSLMPKPIRIRLRKGSYQHLVVLLDVAGEDLESAEIDRDLFGFFGRADSVLFLFDPLCVPEIANALDGIIDLSRISKVEPGAVLSRLVRLMSDGDGGRVRVPTALVLSKFDALQQLESVEDDRWNGIMRHRGAGFQRAPMFAVSGYDERDGDLIQQETAGLLEMLGARALLQRIQDSFEHSRLFAVSALGHDVEGENLSTSGVSAFRVLDPILWSMYIRNVQPPLGNSVPV